MASIFNQNFMQRSGASAEVRQLDDGRYLARFEDHEVEFLVPDGSSDMQIVGATSAPAMRLWAKVSGA